MAQCTCGNFFKLPESDGLPEEYYIYCYTCRSTSYTSIFSDREYVCGGCCNPVSELFEEREYNE